MSMQGEEGKMEPFSALGTTSVFTWSSSLFYVTFCVLRCIVFLEKEKWELIIYLKSYPWSLWFPKVIWLSNNYPVKLFICNACVTATSEKPLQRVNKQPERNWVSRGKRHKGHIQNWQYLHRCVSQPAIILISMTSIPSDNSLGDKCAVTACSLWNTDSPSSKLELLQILKLTLLIL